MLTIVGQGLAGTLVGLEAERRGQSFVVFDQGSGKTASRAAAGLFNPLTGPRLSAWTDRWDRIVPFYREIEQRLGVSLIHEVPLVRSLDDPRSKAVPLPRSAPGWKAELCPRDGVAYALIEGGGWVDIPALLDAARQRWLRQGVLEEEWFNRIEAERVIWCGGMTDFSESWSSVPVASQWQPVRGDVLTAQIPGLELNVVEIGARFLIPLGNHLFRWGATHESDLADLEFRPEARQLLVSELGRRLGEVSFEVVGHDWGVRPCSRVKHPLVQRHPDRPWTLFNGFGGRGVSMIPQWLPIIFD